jgi:hypothetical protein
MALTQGGKDAERGKFSLNFNYIPCPMHYYSIDGYATAKLQSRRFNPKMSSKPYPYYIQRFYTVSCYPDVPFIVPFMGPYPTSMGNPSISPGRLDFPVDTMVLSGAAVIFDENSDMVPVKESTRYVTTDIAPNTNVTNPLHAQSSANLGPIASDYYDFDNDGQPDTSLVGYWETKPDPDTGKSVTKFKTDKLDTVAKSELLQIVYLSSSGKNPAEDPPDFTRATDWQANLNHEGMLRSISPQDFTNTDLYVFRLSDGKLISERLGLAKDDWQWNDEMGADEQTSTFFYHTYLRGYYGDLFRKINGTFVNELNYGDWQAKSGINPALHQRAADHLKPGDKVELIAINRATGYLGSVQTTMQAAGSAGTFGSDMASYIDPIVLRPPNLKIWVDRKFDIKEGLRKGTIVEDQIIGYEGAALSSDQIIAVHTEWLKPDGSAFPIQDDSDATDMGYTGRIAFLTSDQQIASTGQVGIEHFPIKPGKHLQVVQLPGGTQANQQFYIQVSGEPSTGHPIFTTTSSSGKSANFDSTGVHTGKLKNRPNIFVPFLVPVYDEAQTELQRQVHKKLVEDNPGQTYNKPEPTYRWVYRPEFQYSLYDLTLKEINRYQDAADPATKENILNATQPTIASSDDLIEILYNLDITKYTALDYFNSGEEKELIFAIGEQEVKAKVNKQDKLEFTNLEHLANLDPEDFLTMRLYLNNDVGNVLWEYAFDFLALDTRIAGYDNQTDDTWYVTADDPTVPFQSVLVGFAGRDPTSKTKQTVEWSAQNIGIMKPVITSDSDLGVFASDLTMPKIAGMKAKVTATLIGQSETSAVFKTVEVLPGKPAILDVTVTGEASAMGLGEMNISVKVKDNYGNLALDGTSVTFSIEGDAQLAEYDTGTTDGIATATIKGSEIANPTNKLIVSVDALKYEYAFQVHPLTVSLNSFNTTQHVGDTGTVSVSITDFEGNAAPEIGVSFSSSYGTFAESLISTDSNGQAIATLINPRSEGNAELNLQVGHAGQLKQAYVVDYPTAQLRDINVQNAMLVGDQASAGHIEHERFDATKIGLDYQIEKTVKVLGIPGDIVNITLGDLQDPNIEPVAAYYMNELEIDPDGNETAEDETGLHNATAKYINVMKQHPQGKGTSYFFSKGNFDTNTNGPMDSHLQVPHVSTLEQTENVGFRLDFKADAMDATLFDHHSGVLGIFHPKTALASVSPWR